MEAAPQPIFKSEQHGGTHGDTQLFDDYGYVAGNLAHTRLAKIRVWHDDHVYCMQFYFETPGGWAKTQKYKGEIERELWDLKYSEIFIGRHEFIKQVEGRYGNIINFLQIETNMNKYEFGTTDGGDEFEINMPEGHGAVAFYGGYGGHIHHIGVYHSPVTMSLQYQYGWGEVNRLENSVHYGNTHGDTEVID